jgi:hypothetical protein
MTLITTVPALQAHSMVRHGEWRRVVSGFVATRLRQDPEDLVPLMVGHLALAGSMAAFERWVAHPGEALDAHLRTAYRHLAEAFAGIDRFEPAPA